MYTSPSNLIDTVIDLLERNALQLNNLIQVYQSNRSLSVYKGMRQTLPQQVYPSLEIEPGNASNQWATTRAQRPRYNFQFTLTTRTDNESLHVEYITSVASMIVAILTSPENLQLTVDNETRWDPNGGLVPTVILDSLVEDVTFNALHDGSIRTVEFSWFALIHEPYPESKFRIGNDDMPTVLRPNVID